MGSKASSFVLGAVAGAAVAALLERRRRPHAEAQREAVANEREAEAARLASQLVTAEQDERRRLSLALHDGPLQSLSGIVLMHDAVLRGIREQSLDDAARVLETSIARERTAIRELRVPRKHDPGRSWVTVRPYYEELPLRGLDAERMKAGESPPDRGGECLPSVPGSTVPRPKIAAVERRKACALRKARAAAPSRGGGFETAPFGALLPRIVRVGPVRKDPHLHVVAQRR